MRRISKCHHFFWRKTIIFFTKLTPFGGVFRSSLINKVFSFVSNIRKRLTLKQNLQKDRSKLPFKRSKLRFILQKLRLERFALLNFSTKYRVLSAHFLHCFFCRPQVICNNTEVR